MYLTTLEPDNGFVDVNEKNLYLANAPKIEASHEGNTLGSEFDKDYEEEDGFMGKDPIQPPIVAYDKEDPPIITSLGDPLEMYVDPYYSI